MSGQGMAYNTLVSVSERMFPGITVGLGGNSYNTMEYAAVKLGNQVVSSLALQIGRSRFSRKQIKNKNSLLNFSRWKISNESTEVYESKMIFCNVLRDLSISILSCERAVLS